MHRFMLMFPSVAITIMGVVMLAAVMAAAPAAAATHYIGLIGISGATAASGADIGAGLRRVNMRAYGPGGLAAGPALLGSGSAIEPRYGSEPGGFAFEGAGDAAIRVASAHDMYGGNHDANEGYAYDGYEAYVAYEPYAAPSRQPYGAASGSGSPVAGPPESGQPASLIMLVAGLGLLGMIARRRTVLR